ncbi:MAG: peptidase C1 [Sulfurimonas sp.]|nr:MAG: peptidase C1 [Sulfurimonas sp.]
MPKMSYSNRVLDARPDRLDLRDREYRPPLESLPPQWPVQDDLEGLFPCYRDDGMILDQGKEGACTGFGLAAVINYLLWRQHLHVKKEMPNIHTLKVSARMLYHMARIYDEFEGEDYEGSSCRGAMKGWHRHGVCKEHTWPYVANNTRAPQKQWAREAVQNPLGAYYRINKDSIVDMQAAIKEVGAIYCSAIIHQGWWLKACETLPIIAYNSNTIGGHAFAIVGYNADGFMVQNSWGSSWGFCGFAVIPYKEWVENGSDAWVAVLGAPVRLAASPHTFSNHSLQTVAADYTERGSRMMRSTLNYPYENTRAMPWNEEEAYRHTLVIGNDGRPKLRIVSEPDPERSARKVCYEYIKAWMKKSQKNRKIAIYVHGGLNSEEDSINRIRILAPYFKANGVYPLFITWKTGFVESIVNQIQDQISEIFFSAGMETSSARAQGIMDKFQEAIDRAIESFSRKIVVKGVWSEMKENAAFASDRAVPGYAQHGSKTKPGAMVILSEELHRLHHELDCDIHLVGHSAGAILLGHWLDELVKRQLAIASLTLYAPACTVAFANKHYIKACEKSIFAKAHMSVYMMDDERERADSVGIYQKSLLYLVSRALESIHKMPLLGMAAAWDMKYAKAHDIFNEANRNDLKKWHAFSTEIHRIVYNKSHSKVSTSRRGDFTDLAHGSFDNDIEVIEQTLKQICGVTALAVNVENLQGF